MPLIPSCVRKLLSLLAEYSASNGLVMAHDLLFDLAKRDLGVEKLKRHYQSIG